MHTSSDLDSASALDAAARLLNSVNELRRLLAAAALALRPPLPALSSRAFWFAGSGEPAVRLLPKLEAVAAASAAATPDRRVLGATAFIAESST